MSERMLAWVRSYGPSRLARDLGTYRVTVHSWTNSVLANRVTPSLDFVKRIIQLSREQDLGVGPLTYEDFFGDVDTMAKATVYLSQAAKECLTALAADDTELRFDAKKGRFHIRIGSVTLPTRQETVDALDRARVLSRVRGETPAYVINEIGRRRVQEMREQ